MTIPSNLAELVLPQVESIRELKVDKDLIDKIKGDVAIYVLQKVNRDGAFFPAYHLALLQTATKERFQAEGRYLGRDLLLERNPYFKELKSGVIRLRDMTLSNAVKYHPDNNNNGAVVLRDVGEAKIRHFKLVYRDAIKLGRYLASICDSDIADNGKIRIFFKPEYSLALSAVDKIKVPNGI